MTATPGRSGRIAPDLTGLPRSVAPWRDIVGLGCLFETPNAGGEPRGEPHSSRNRAEGTLDGVPARS